MAMHKNVYENYTAILKNELVVALGCTEPIAIAYAGAKAREVLGRMPERIEVSCSGNIVKNVKGVTVPNSGGLKGINVAAILKTVGGNAEKKLAVLETITETDIDCTKKLLNENFCRCDLIENVENLYIIVKAFAGRESAEVEIKDYHSNITRVTKNGELQFAKEELEKKEESFPDKSMLNVKDILEFAEMVNLAELEDVLARQIAYNSVKLLAKAYATAGSDARMSGCPLPVVINSGSGNQGITDTIANIGGMVCDGAKPSCAAKISSAVEAAILAVHMATKNRVFQSGEGLVKENVEETIRSIGRMGREGMKATDIEILNIMLDK